MPQTAPHTAHPVWRMRGVHPGNKTGTAVCAGPWGSQPSMAHANRTKTAAAGRAGVLWMTDAATLGVQRWRERTSTDVTDTAWLMKPAMLPNRPQLTLVALCIPELTEPGGQKTRAPP